ncbi:hypothetical protein WG70_00160 [Burkholderia oklahomensis EO147]|nr:hypothetical protein WG70_00160 [Burkholderia oklahomensis EO147]KUY47944.1 hypothetical protein WG70_22015 [Burkholderia oklahomensis EO147]
MRLPSIAAAAPGSTRRYDVIDPRARTTRSSTPDPRISTVLAIADALGLAVGYLRQSERVYSQIP